MELVRVLVVDDHPLVRQGIIKFLGLEDAFKVVGEAGTGAEAMKLIPSTNPDVILLDINLPDITGIEVCKRIKAQYPHCKVIALTVYDDEAHVLESIKAGVTGYLPKDVNPDTFIEAIKYAAGGESYIHPSVAGKLMDDYGRLSSKLEMNEKHSNPLTPREIEVLSLAAKGCTNKNIANELFISEKTVKNHITNIFKKIKVKDRTEAVVYALKNNII